MLQILVKLQAPGQDRQELDLENTLVCLIYLITLMKAMTMMTFPRFPTLVTIVSRSSEEEDLSQDLVEVGDADSEWIELEREPNRDPFPMPIKVGKINPLCLAKSFIACYCYNLALSSCQLLLFACISSYFKKKMHT